MQAAEICFSFGLRPSEAQGLGWETVPRCVVCRQLKESLRPSEAQGWGWETVPRCGVCRQLKQVLRGVWAGKQSQVVVYAGS